MSWSIRLVRLAGIPVYMHWTFLVLLAFIGGQAYLGSGRDPAAAAEAVGLILSVFGCVVLHELGHALMARRFGVSTADITLLPIGGVARLQRMPEHPRQELLIAIAGPAVNVVIAASLIAGMWLSGQPMIELTRAAGGFMIDMVHPLTTLAVVNVFLVLFNLIPAFPMDGGRVLRALLAMRMPYARATRAAATVGQSLAIGFALYGLFGSGNPILLLIALFVWIGAEGEARQAEERVGLRGVRVRDAMLTDYQALDAGETLGRAVALLLAGSQHDFPVLDARDGTAPVGVLTRTALMKGLSESGRDGPVARYMQPGLGTIEADAPLVPALARLRGGEGPCLQVLEPDGRPVGLLTLENIGELIMIRTALRGTETAGERRQLARTYESAEG